MSATQAAIGPDALAALLRAALSPAELEILDEGGRHVGHANAGGGHYRVQIRSDAFRGLALIERHRLVYDAVGARMGSGVHALSIDARTPEEPAF